MNNARWRSLIERIDSQAWVRFFLALAGLALAFAAALYSTIFRDQGNLLATAIAASLALMLAALVGITTVPYLARRVSLPRLRERFIYEGTREGAAFIILALVIGIAALNTGNNLLYIVVSAMLAAFLMSGVASAGMLRALELDVALPVHIFANRKLLARFGVSNRRRWAPAFSISVKALERPQRQRRHWRPGIWGWPPWQPPEKQRLRLRDWVYAKVPSAQQAPPIFSGSVYFPYIPRRATAGADVELNFPRRGRYSQKELGLSTRFPFSFLIKTRPVAFSRDIIVYPSVEETEEFFQALPMITGEFEMFVRGRGHDLYLIREHMAGDSARHVDWKATAKTGVLKVREFTREDERKLRIVFDNPSPGAVSEPAYEASVSLAASLAWHFAQSDAQLSFAGQSYGGGEDVYDFLSHLATVSPADGASLLDDLAVSDDYNVILTARPQGSIPTRLWACSYFLFMHEKEAAVL